MCRIRHSSLVSSNKLYAFDGKCVSAAQTNCHKSSLSQRTCAIYFYFYANTFARFKFQFDLMVHSGRTKQSTGQKNELEEEVKKKMKNLAWPPHVLASVWKSKWPTKRIDQVWATEWCKCIQIYVIYVSISFRPHKNLAQTNKFC